MVSKTLRLAMLTAATMPTIATATATVPQELDIGDPTSIRNVAATLAYGTMALYTGNVTNTTETLAVFPSPIYWWEAGAAWGSMLKYQHYTGDESYNDVITQSILSQVGPNYDYMVPAHYGDEGNDDQAFWSFTVLDAAEMNFPQPDGTIPPWLDMAGNIWNTMVSRWNTSYCGGGLLWQIFPSNPNGMNYKNSVSNGGLFQLSARLARATGNSTYMEWAEKIWDWSVDVGFIDENYNVYDGADSTDNCSVVNKLSFSYAQGIYLYGAAVLYNYTSGNETWGDRTTKLLDAASSYFSPYDNSTNIMFEHACETVGTCDTDMLSFKAYLSRFMWSTTRMMTSTLTDVQTVLNVSAVAAAKACSGETNGTVCGQKWYVGGYDNYPGLGQQLSALETVHGLLSQDAPAPYGEGEIKHVTVAPTTAPTATATATSTGTPSPSSHGGTGLHGSNAWVPCLGLAGAVSLWNGYGIL
ncbi:mannan endo-1,6-alpha-mannosidase DCW1-like protein [Xylariales sp. PMI_506]|nr:mannan endo-1,6-alpha-mannosidase DCW1-like protein [Xylariales sp. PMI_506]